MLGSIDQLKNMNNNIKAGVKVDFMKRNDQYMVRSYEKIAEVAAKYKILVNFHGAFKPSGIERRWPNVFNL